MSHFLYLCVEEQQPEVHLALPIGTTEVVYPWQAVISSLAYV